MAKQKVCCSHSRCAECMVGVESPWLRPSQRGICTTGPSKNTFDSTGPLGEGAEERVLALLTQCGWVGGLRQGDKFLRALVSSSGKWP